MSDLGIVLNNSMNGISQLQDNDAFGYNNSRLANFIAKTSSTDIASDVIDPLCTFDVEFKFFPNSYQHGENTKLYEIALKYMKVGKENGNAQLLYTDQLILQLGYYIQSMTLPLMSMPENGKVPTLFGEFPVNNLYIKPDNNTFTMSVLNTKISIHDFLFYPWMREVTLPLWSYNKLPYTTATVTVKFDKHCNTRYVFVGCRPSLIFSRQPTQEPVGEPTRDITMLFDYMFILDASYYSTCTNKYDSSTLTTARNLFLNTLALLSKLNI